MAAEVRDIVRIEGASNENLRRLTISLYRRRWWIVGGTFFCTVAAVILAFVVTPIYLASATLVPVESDMSSSSLMGNLNSLGGLAQFVGLSGLNKPRVTEAITLLKSRQFTEDFIQQRNLLPILFEKRWNAGAGRWKRGARIPDLWDGYRLFDRKIRFVDQNDRTGVVTLRIEWRDPEEAADWANDLVRRVNEEMRERALKETLETLTYLKQELNRTNVVAVQNALQDLIEANLKREAIADVRTDYVFRVVDPAAPPDLRHKFRPHKIVYLIVGFFLGLLLSILAVMTADGMETMERWLKD
jgi:uncharacterized protein involved in exopolysaccharide biosynthesis